MTGKVFHLSMIQGRNKVRTIPIQHFRETDEIPQFFFGKNFFNNNHNAVERAKSKAISMPKKSTILDNGKNKKKNGNIIFSYHKKAYFCNLKSGNSSVGRAAASQAAGRGFETRLPLTLTTPRLTAILVVKTATEYKSPRKKHSLLYPILYHSFQIIAISS